MVIILKPQYEERQLNHLLKWLEGYKLKTALVKGEQSTILGLIGDTSKVDIETVKAIDIVESVKRIQEPFKAANRKFHPDDTVIDVSGQKIGGKNFTMMAGPCSVESREQICEIAASVKSAGAGVLRGGAFKPRTSPYAFQGLRAEGIELMLEAKKATGLPIVSEIMNINDLKLFDDVDIIQVGARNMQNFEMLKELGCTNKPILLKRGLASTMEELLMSAEYILSGGNKNVMLCERGIRTFETYTRNTLDLSAIPLLKEHSHLPVLVDPSHATGISRLVKPMSMAAAAAGADGLIIEVHNDPAAALCDGAQSLTPEAFSDLARSVNALLPGLGKKTII
ncbi:MAG: 3-deoxy-7-phosphoheptulonate synthase [Chitinispirillia bacterium]|nr:3-deoxy-7-phosphoheptulonate synthase [Chitinispirillia bacterium]